MADRDDQEFERFLQGQHPLNQALDEAQQAQVPDTALDQRIRQRARQAKPGSRTLGQRLTRSWGLWSTAASLMLATLLIFLTLPERDFAPRFESADVEPAQAPAAAQLAGTEVLTPTPESPLRQRLGAAPAAPRQAEEAEVAPLVDSLALSEAPTIDDRQPAHAKPAPARKSAPDETSALADAAAPPPALSRAPSTTIAAERATVPEPALRACDEVDPARQCGDNARPVCASLDTGVRCLTTPCPSARWQAFADACAACAEDKILGYVEGDCPPAPTPADPAE